MRMQFSNYNIYRNIHNNNGRTRRVFWEVFKNFVDSFKPRQSTSEGIYIGHDLNGNKFYEVAAEPQKGKRLPRRWFVPEKEMNFDVANMSAEWDAWLRNRRNDPPTIEELKQNLAIAQIKKIKAEQLKEGITDVPALEDKHASMSSFPKHEGFEVNPGEGPYKQDK